MESVGVREIKIELFFGGEKNVFVLFRLQYIVDWNPALWLFLLSIRSFCFFVEPHLQEFFDAYWRYNIFEN